MTGRPRIDEERCVRSIISLAAHVLCNGQAVRAFVKRTHVAIAGINVIIPCNVPSELRQLKVERFKQVNQNSI